MKEEKLNRKKYVNVRGTLDNCHIQNEKRTEGRAKGREFNYFSLHPTWASCAFRTCQDRNFQYILLTKKNNLFQFDLDLVRYFVTRVKVTCKRFFPPRFLPCFLFYFWIKHKEGLKGLLSQHLSKEINKTFLPSFLWFFVLFCLLFSPLWGTTWMSQIFLLCAPVS